MRLIIAIQLVCALWLGQEAFANDLPKPIPPYRLDHQANQAELLARYERLKVKVSDSPNAIQSLIELAEVESDLGDIDQGIKHARSAANQAPDDWRVHALLAKLFLLDRNALSARLQAERALELTKNQDNRQAVICLLLPALVDCKDFSRADKLSKIEVKRSPKDPLLIFCRAFVLSTSVESQQEAITTYRAAMALDPSLQECHYNLALLLVAASEQKEAINELKSCLQASSGTQTGKLAEELISKLSHQD